MLTVSVQLKEGEKPYFTSHLDFNDYINILIRELRLHSDFG